MIGRREVFDQAMRLGHSAAWDQQWDRAIAAYGTALKEFPDEPLALSSLGFVLLQANNLASALQLYQRAASLNPGDPMAPEKCGEIFERQGRLNEAAQTYLAVAEIHLKRRDVQKAMDNWNRVARLTPDNLAAHTRLALAAERTNLTRQAVVEYIEVARIFQRARDTEKATAAANRALQLDPKSSEARDALDKLRRGVPLPLPERPKAATGELMPFGAEGLAALQGAGAEPAAKVGDTKASPLSDAQRQALGQLAEMLFEEDAELAKKSVSVDALTRGTGKLRGDQARRSLAIKYLGQAIGLQSGGETAAAIAQYENALNNGLESPSVNLVLGGLQLERDKPAEAIRRFNAAVQHELFGIGALFGLGQAQVKLGQTREGVKSLLEALKRLDQKSVPPDKQDALAETYESLWDGLQNASPEELAPIANNIIQFLTGADWHERVAQARRQLDGSALDGQIAPLADLLAVPGASEVVESLRRIETYMSQKRLATAMEEAYFALTQSPTHLPIHIRMAEILTAEGKTQAAIDKYAMIAETYRARGELVRAARITQQVLRLSPLDVTMRSWLIELLVEQHKTEEALQQFFDLAETFYQLADLESARNTYADALILAQQNNVAPEWSVKLLHKLGDIDLQRLNWHEAQHVYEQIKALAPDDEPARATLIDLLFRLDSGKQALAETDSYLRQLLTARNTAGAISLLEEMVETHPHEAGLVARLGRLYQDTGRRAEAIAQYDRLGELQLQAGQTAQAAETIRLILTLKPDDPGAYEQLLNELLHSVT
jgi:tetratricopeptide (TPR) repeat protein